MTTEPENTWSRAHQPAVGLPLWLLFFALATTTQLAFKWGGTELDRVEFGVEWFRVLARSPAVLLAVLGYIAMFAIWLTILQRTSLARAFLMTGLVYTTVPLGAWALFGERISGTHAIGIAVIVAGVALMGQPSRPPPPPSL